MKRRWVNLSLAGVLVLALAVLLISLRPSAPEAPRSIVTAAVGTVTATVTANGTVERSGTVDLTFGSVGTVTEVAVRAGDRVQQGDVLARIDNVLALQQLASAESTLAQARGSASTAQQTLTNAIATAQATNERNRNAVTQSKSNLRAAEALWSDACVVSSDPTCPNPAAQAQVRAAEATVTSAQATLDAAIATATSNATRYGVALNQAFATQNQARAERDASCDPAGTSTCRAAESGLLTAQQAFENARLARDAGILADTQAVTSATNSLASANVALQRVHAELRMAGRDAVRTARQALTNAEQTYALGEITGRQSVAQAESSAKSVAEEAPAASDAAVTAAEAAVAAAQAAVDDTVIIAPIDGIVGEVSYVVGEVSTGSSPTDASGITLVPTGALEVLADFAESDAAKVRVGDPVTVTFAALAGATAQGTVAAVDGVATTGANALVTYGVRVQLTDAPEGVSEGMTASVTVTVDEVTDVLFLPPGVITERDGQAFVLRPGPEDTTEEVTITLGLKGDTGTEVTGGLAVGDTVVVPEADESGSQQPDSGIPGGSN
ncbi:MAG: efflux RND transporter periplasmic adaptor subunit [Actinomycetota bacterium]